MSIVTTLDTLTEWVQKNICEGVLLKAPPEGDTAPTDAGYAYTLVTPTAFPMFVPAKDKLSPPVRHNFPSVCVRFLKGSESLKGREGFMDVQLCFSTWSPGQHKGDIVSNPGGVPVPNFQRNAEGWRDAWNLVDKAVMALGNSVSLNGLELDRAAPIEYGPLTEQGEIVEAYPLWFAWVSFSINYPLRRNAEDIEELL